ncbi:MAG TPA: hypothetical protein DG757_09500 [Bacillus sp. (in: Bacteria)]|nr:hypothetical protein [Bacillus sp. (in: firmicutes)]
MKEQLETLSGNLPVFTKPAYEYGIQEFSSEGSFGTGLLTGEQDYRNKYGSGTGANPGCAPIGCCCGSCGSSQAKKV